MPRELREIEVDEVSLVDRPATGKRFVLFKRGGWRTRGEDDANICSKPPTLDAIQKRLEALDGIAARLDEASQILKRLEDEARASDARLSALERAHPARQSEDAGTAPQSLWAGLL